VESKLHSVVQQTLNHPSRQGPFSLLATQDVTGTVFLYPAFPKYRRGVTERQS
jgi:hypothetical protein